jgi:polysaccharide deacetylase 2 family uncharacterized protein YibQ
VVVVILIAALFFLLERLKSKHTQDAELKPATVESPVVRGKEEYSHKHYTTAQAASTRKPGRPAIKQHLPGALAVIVDDMGSSVTEARELLSIDIPITFSIIPGLPKVRGVADAADSAGREIMVHIPMEPQGYPKQRLEANGLLVSQSAEEIAARTVELLNAVPHAKGANNHMGSRFTEQEEKMLPVLKVLKGRGQFFIDSRTSPRSTGYATAQRLGVRAASRSVFLDNQQDVAEIKKQLYAAAELSRKKGGVIAICHPHPATITALKEAMPELQRSGITFVSAGELVR